VTFTYVLTISLNYIHPLHYFPSFLLPPLFRTISKRFAVLDHTRIQNTSTISALLDPLCLHSPSYCYLPPGQGLFYLPVLHFSKCVCIGWSREFHFGISDMCMSCFNQFSTLYYFLFLYCPAPQLFSSLQCIALYYLLTQMHCISIPNIL
jgi:hypothetical protein